MRIAMLKYLAEAGRLYQRLQSPLREEAGLTQTDLDILLFLANNPSYDTASDIVSVRRLAKSNVSVGVRNLEGKGLLRRCLDEQDHRVEHLSLTPAAARLTALGQEKQMEFDALLFQDFTSEDRAALEHLMDRIHQNVSRALKNLM